MTDNAAGAAIAGELESEKRFSQFLRAEVLKLRAENEALLEKLERYADLEKRVQALEARK